MLPNNLRNKVDNLYQECWDLARHIVQARKQISALRPKKLQNDKIPTAFKEMDEIVKSTEEASNTIMESAEEIVAAMGDDLDPALRETIQQNCNRIFESCAFQDLTGQRISKVMTTLQMIDEHLEKLQELLGPDFEDAEADDDEPEAGSDADLLNGPALTGEGISQDDIDKLFD